MIGSFEGAIYECSECGNRLEVEDVDECDGIVYIRPCEVCIEKQGITKVEKEG